MPRAVIPFVLLSTACATVGGLRNEPLDQGVSRRFAASFDSVMAVIDDAVMAAGLDLKESRCWDDTTCMVIGTVGVSLGPSGSMGSMARVVVEGEGETTVVRVISRRRVGSQEAAKNDYSPEILSQIAVRLGMLS